MKLGRIGHTIGPGIALAATGIGAGDMVSTALAGQKFGQAVLWSAMAGALIKWIITEGLARWQVAGGETLIEGWHRHFHRAFSIAFLLFLIVWSFTVGGALMVASGMAASALVPKFSIPVWGAFHAFMAFVLVFIGRYLVFERIMKCFITLLFLIVLICGFLLIPESGRLLSGLFMPRIPDGSLPFLLGVIGGIGGSLTVLNYGYWIREKGWQGKDLMKRVRVDLIVAYLLTGIFGVAIMSIAAQVDADAVQGNQLVIALGKTIGEQLTPWLGQLFILGFWGAVFSSMLGVWQGVPYLFADTLQLLSGTRKPGQGPSSSDRSYRIGLLFLTIVPLPLLWMDEPVWAVVLYTVLGALFMPVIIASLLILNERYIESDLKNGLWSKLGLSLALLVFAYLGIQEMLGGLIE